MPNETCQEHIELPSNERGWHVYIIVSCVIYITGLIIILIGRSIWRVLRKWSVRNEADADLRKPFQEYKGWYLQVKEFAVNLDTGKSWLGKLLVVLSVLLNTVAFMTYLYLSNEFPIEFCHQTSDSSEQGVHTRIWGLELFLYIFFAFNFVIRFIVATDKLTFWAFNLYTAVDILTLPIVFIQYQQNTTWLGLRFLRVVHIRELPDVLRFLNLLDAGTTYIISKIGMQFLTVLLASSGMVHLLENTGDFWSPHNYENRNKMGFFECFYFMIVTISTVGYGDYSCETYLGRIFCIIAIVFGLGLFARAIPTILNFMMSYTKYDRSFKMTPGKRHIIVTGHINDESVNSFIKDFLHPDRQCESNVSVVFLAPVYPTFSIEAIHMKHPSSVYYFKGTVYNLKDCNRVKMKDADAVIVLCDKKSTNPEAGDATNITRVISMKKFFRKQRHIRCIVQLMRRENKTHLQNFQHWNEDKGDAIVCIDELKLGFMAQCCYSPGFSTLLANLFVMRSSDTIPKSKTWKDAYIHGVSCEIYSTTLSKYFKGLTFPKATEICFSKLGLLLVAIEEMGEDNESIFVLNPDESVRIMENTRAFIIAQDSKSVEKAKKYCGKCHQDIVKVKMKLPDCNCYNDNTLTTVVMTPSKNYIDYQSMMNRYSEPQISNTRRNTIYGSINTGKRLSLLGNIQDQYKARCVAAALNSKDKLFDVTGTYFWCPERNFADATMTLEEAREQNLFGHVIVLVISDANSPSLGIRQLIQPLRASNQQYQHLKKIIILGDEKFLKNEWTSISTFPDVYIVQGSPYRQIDLYSINVHYADMVIVLSPQQINLKDIGQCEIEALSDKEVIMVTLNLRAMTFENITAGTPYAQNRALLMNPGNPVNGNFPQLSKHDADSKLHHKLRAVSSNDFILRQDNGETIRMITELVYDSNTLYIDDGDDDMMELASEGIWMTQSYACGTIFTDSVLDFLTSATYFNGDILTIVRNLVTGCVNPELDIILSQGRQPEGTKETDEIKEARNRCRVAQLAMNDPLFRGLGEISTFGDLFMKALREHGTLCLGLYRLHQLERRSKSLNKRYVINFPPDNFTLHSSDLVYVLLQFKEKGTSLLDENDESQFTAL